MEVTDDMLAQEIKTLIEPLAITCPEDFDSPDQIPKEVLLNTVLFAYILHSDSDSREYGENDVRISTEEADNQCRLLFGDGVELNPMDYVQVTGSERVYYDPQLDRYCMPSMGYYFDLPRVDKVEKTDTGYRATVAFIPYNMGEEQSQPLEEMEPSRVVVYDLEMYEDQLVVAGLANQ